MKNQFFTKEEAEKMVGKILIQTTSILHFGYGLEEDSIGYATGVKKVLASTPENYGVVFEAVSPNGGHGREIISKTIFRKKFFLQSYAWHQKCWAFFYNFRIS